MNQERERGDMIKSMTGYGRARKVLNARDITVEIKSVNNRYLDCTVKMPRAYLFAEDDLKRRVQKAVSRGKADIFVTVDASAADTEKVTVNRELASSYTRAMRELIELSQEALFLNGNGGAGAPERVTPFEMAKIISRFPDVLSVVKSDENLEQIGADLCEVLDEALEAYCQARISEGRKLAEDFELRLNRVEEYVEKIEARSPELVNEYREKLYKRLKEVLKDTTIDEQRILTEAAIFADKTAVDEETVRLKSHVSQMRDLLQSDAPQGRRMDFFIQEMNREANTIGSKCNDLEIARVVVELKAEIEKMREQAQNVE